MRMIVALPLPLLLLAGCNVSKDNANNTVSLTLNEVVAANKAADVGNTAQNIAADIGNEVKTTGEKIDNKVGSSNSNSSSAVTVNKDVKTTNTTATKKT
jgi:uncharacterized protein YcfL